MAAAIRSFKNSSVADRSFLEDGDFPIDNGI
jgi:hypothetical protein